MTVSSRRVLCLLLLTMASSSASAWAQTTRYVDTQIASTCSTYAPSTRSCSDGSAAAYKDLQAASAAAQPGDTVLIRQGTFTAQFAPTTSGTSDAPIIYRAYTGETPTISGVNDAAIYVLNRNYLVIDGLTVTNVLGWGRLENSTFITVQNNHFSAATATGTTGGFKLVSSSHNRILNNSIADGNDNMLLQDSHYNLIVGNSFSQARHTLLNVSCSNFNVIRGNVFNNPAQKGIENFDCEGTVTNQPVKLDATKHNVWEANVFSGTKSSTRDYDFNAMQYAGQDGIVRRNVYYDNLGGGINFQVYADEALYNYGHRVYHNTFYNNRCEGIAAANSSTSSQYTNNIVKNNLLYKNLDCSGAANQTSIGNTSAVVLSSNALATANPMFVSETARDLRLQSGSPHIDTASFLTTASAAGSGTSLKVADATYFYDGYGIAGEVGDTIQLAGQTQRAVVVAVDFTTNVLTLDRSLTWTSGQGVALAYEGSAPDMGAYEMAAGGGSTAPAPPTNLRILN